MGRKATGSAYKRDGQLYALVTLPKAPGETKARRVPKACPPKVKTLAQAKAWSAWLSEQLRAGKLVLDVPPPPPPPGGETFEAWCERWLAAREARHLSSVKDDRSRLRTHVWPWLHNRPIASVTTDDLERLVKRLDARIHDGTLAWRTARNVWGVVSKAFADARRSKDPTLRVRADNPALDVAPPDEGVTKTKVYLYPSELLAVLHQGDVPLRWKRLLALSIYLYPRAGELEALDWSDVDLARGIAHIHRSIDRFRKIGAEKSTKTGEARKLLIEPALLPLLRAMHVEAGSPASGRVVKMPPAEDLAERLRKYLEWAGVSRAELHVGASDATRKRLTWHDLRATGITWRAVRGDDPLRIQHDAGHRNFGTTQGYIREASNLGAGFGDVFPPLPAELLAALERS
jgi:integrase